MDDHATINWSTGHRYQYPVNISVRDEPTAITPEFVRGAYVHVVFGDNDPEQFPRTTLECDVASVMLPEESRLWIVNYVSPGETNYFDTGQPLRRADLSFDNVRPLLLGAYGILDHSFIFASPYDDHTPWERQSLELPYPHDERMLIMDLPQFSGLVRGAIERSQLDRIEEKAVVQAGSTQFIIARKGIPAVETSRFTIDEIAEALRRSQRGESGTILGEYLEEIGHSEAGPVFIEEAATALRKIRAKHPEITVEQTVSDRWMNSRVLGRSIELQ